MDRPQLFEYVKKTYGVEPDYPWHDWNAVLRHKDNQKWFGVVMEVERRKLGLKGDTLVDIINVKAEPMLIASLINRAGFYPSYHMNKENWISICLDGSAPDEEIKSLLDMSFGMTETKKKKGLHEPEESIL